MLFAQLLLLAAEEGVEEEEGIDLLIPETNELIAGIIAFAIVFFFIWKFAWPMINRALEARQAAVREELEGAEKAKAEAESLLGDYQQQLAEARSEAARIVDEARQAADTAGAEIKARAQQEADAILRKAREDAAAEQERARAALRDEVATLSLDVAEKVLAERVDRTSSEAMVNRFIEELGGLRK